MSNFLPIKEYFIQNRQRNRRGKNVKFREDERDRERETQREKNNLDYWRYIFFPVCLFSSEVKCLIFQVWIFSCWVSPVCPFPFGGYELSPDVYMWSLGNGTFNKQVEFIYIVASQHQSELWSLWFCALHVFAPLSLQYAASNDCWKPYCSLGCLVSTPLIRGPFS